MEITKLSAERRELFGTANSNRLRKQNKVPCNIYGGKENQSILVDYNTIKKALFTNVFVALEINVDGQLFKAIPKEMQFHPVSNELIHVDFQELIDGTTVKTEVPLMTKGFSQGQKIGGKLEIKLRKVKIKALAEKIPSFIEIDVTPLKLGKSLRVKDIDTKGDYEIMNAPGIPIVTIGIPRALRSEQASAAGASNDDEDNSEDEASTEE